MTKALALCTTVLLLTGCASGEPTRYYLIKAVTPSTASMGQHPAIELLDVEIPQYLERYQIASRRADNRVVFAASNQWGENLRKNLTRAIARNLINELGTTTVGSPDLRLTGSVDVFIKVFIEQFERGPDGFVYLTARWQLLDSNRQTLENTSTQLSSSIPVDSMDYAATVSELSNLVARLSHEMVKKVRNQE